MQGGALTTRPPLPWFLRWPGLLLVGAVALSYRASEGNFALLFAANSRAAMGDFALGFWPPAHGTEFLQLMVTPFLETIAIAFLGTSLALIIAVPLSFLAASPDILSTSGDRPGWLRRVVFYVARLLLNLMRSIPELIWALIFVRALGIGPAAGVVAIGIGYAGILGKVFAEIFESVPRGAVEGLAAGGASPLRAFSFGIVPSAMPLMGSYALYRFDCALRASAILGIVGAGGLGMQLELSMKMFAYDEVATQVLVLFTLVAAVDQLSQWVRGKLQKSKGLLPLGRRALAGRVGFGLVWAAAAALSVVFLDLPLSDLFSKDSLTAIGDFVGSMFPPDLDPEFLRATAPAVIETLAISVLGTALAAVVGLMLAYPAAYRLYGQALELDSGRGHSRRWLRRAAAAAASGFLNIGRTLPELLWALVFIFAIGLGPFAGALALAVHTAGVLGRLYSEALEEVPTGALWAARAAGGKHFASTLFAVVPQAFPQLLAYTLYRWEVNIRASAVLGVVGAGGLGMALHVSLSLFHHHRTLTLIAIILLMVTAVDLFSGWLRSRVAAASGKGAALRHAVKGNLEVEVEGRALLVLELSMRGGQVFARQGDLLGATGTLVKLRLAPGTTRPIPCRARIAWRRDEMAGSFVGFAFEGLGVWTTWRIYRLIGSHPVSASTTPELPGSIEAW